MNPKKKNLTVALVENSALLLAAEWVYWAGILALLVLPDERLNRVKLIGAGVGLAAAAVLWVWAQAWEAEWRVYPTKMHRWVGIYLATGAGFYLASRTPDIALSEGQRLWFSLGSFALAAQMAAREDGDFGKKLRWVLGAGLFSQSLYAVLQHWNLGLAIATAERSFASFGNPIFFAAMIIALWPWALAQWIKSQTSTTKFFWALTSLLSLLALFLAQTRASVLGLVVGMAAWAFWRWKNHATENSRRPLLILAAIALFVAMVPQTREAVLSSRFLAREQTHSVIWKDVWRMGWSKPATGFGLGSFYSEFPAHASPELLKIFPQTSHFVNDAHNEYLQTFAETGLVGLAVFVAMCAAFFIGIARSPAAPLDAQALSAGCLALLVQNFFSVDLRFQVSAILLFSCMGWAAALAAPLPTRRFRLPKILRAALALGALALTVWLLRGLVRPYMAQRNLNAEADFFERNLAQAQSIADLEKLVETHPQNWQAWEKLGFYLAKNMQVMAPNGQRAFDRQITDRAIFALKKAHELNPSALGPANNLGNIYYTLSRQSEAMTWWQEALKTNPNAVDVRINLGLAYYNSGQIRAAAEAFQQVLKIDPHNEKALVMLRRLVE